MRRASLVRYVDTEGTLRPAVVRQSDEVPRGSRCGNEVGREEVRSRQNICRLRICIVQ